MTIGVLIADDDAFARAGIRRILQSQEDIRVVGEVADGTAVVGAARDVTPDVVLMDVEMPPGTTGGLDAIPALGELLGHPCRVLVLTVFNRDDYIYQALRFGASGFLPKATPPENLIHAIRVVAGGDALVVPETTRLMERNAPAQPDPRVATEVMDNTTPREREVLVLLARGYSTAEIGDRLFIGEATVKAHIQNTRIKLNCRDRIQLVIKAYEAGLVRPGS